MAFRGQFDYSLDAKNRLNLPPKFRAAFVDGIVLSKQTEPCVLLWTPQGFEGMTESYLAGFHPLSTEHQRITRLLTQNSYDAELDASGRVTLKPQLLEHAGIEGRSVIVAGTNDHVEIWDPERWLAMQAELGPAVAAIAEGLGHRS